MLGEKRWRRRIKWTYYEKGIRANLANGMYLEPGRGKPKIPPRKETDSVRYTGGKKEQGVNKTRSKERKTKAKRRWGVDKKKTKKNYQSS